MPSRFDHLAEGMYEITITLVFPEDDPRPTFGYLFRLANRSTVMVHFYLVHEDLHKQGLTPVELLIEAELNERQTGVEAEVSFYFNNGTKWSVNDYHIQPAAPGRIIAASLSSNMIRLPIPTKILEACGLS